MLEVGPTCSQVHGHKRLDDDVTENVKLHCSFTFSVASSHLRLPGNILLYRVEGVKMRCYFLLFSGENILSHKLFKSRDAFCRTDDARVSNLILITTALCNNLEHLRLTR